ncbi:hypothetical protein CLF_106319 [Clonorchis sinensis]|uniref:Uncharacterized protein n=1 Tax=Clonorchis sinensis TaxID=79923 RepID=G7YEY4_CLOSI|nr:hypothetical protein CLF_106319 [Clonorchis sinensis]
MEEEKLVAYFLQFVGKWMYILIKNLVHPESPNDISCNTINVVAAERARLNMLTRSHFQSVCDFVLQLQTQAAKCDYGVQLGDQLRDRLIAGIRLPELQQNLLLCPDQIFRTIRKLHEQYEDVHHVTKAEEAVLLNHSKRNISKMHPDNKLKPRTGFRASNPSIGRLIDHNSDSAVQKIWET